MTAKDSAGDAGLTQRLSSCYIALVARGKGLVFYLYLVEPVSNFLRGDIMLGIGVIELIIILFALLLLVIPGTFAVMFLLANEKKQSHAAQLELVPCPGCGCPTPRGARTCPQCGRAP